MKLISLLLTIAICLTGSTVSAQTGYEITADSILNHLKVLASDSLEGREVGEPGEWKAAQYIKSIFETAGLEPKGDNGTYLQAFEFTKRIEFGPDNRLSLNSQEMSINDDYQPMNHSASMAFDFDEVVSVGYGIVTEDSTHNDYAGLDINGKAVLISRYTPEPNNNDDSTISDTTFDRYSGLVSKMVTAINHGAAAVFFYTPISHDDTIITIGVTHVKPKDIPVIFVRRRGLEKLRLDLTAPQLTSAKGVTDLNRVRGTGYNVIGYLQGATDTVSIVGAHYDHLGWGTPTSRYHGAEKKIHYGADDNGSGTAAVLELARAFSSRQDELDESILFIAFSGEESGTLGSGHYVRNWTVDRSVARMMINMDMIGRLADQDKGLAIMGTGTCPEFKEYLDQKDMGNLTVVFKESGSGPSDHAPFYHDSIPCLNFFTGAHEDYHTPNDVIEKIDLNGVVTVARLVADILWHFTAYDGPLTFHRTKDKSASGGPSNLTVKFGIMPDFITEHNGLGINGVSTDQPADQAGILKGDIIIKMDERHVGDIYDYMNALKKYRKGDSCDVTLVRGTDTLTVLVEFK
ncbi:MAG: M28 family peptidase [candidate division Zixibacteria bacterium]|nr:M28 family peptidase [candidate division Zixibacteria bacterium]